MKPKKRRFTGIQPLIANNAHEPHPNISHDERHPELRRNFPLARIARVLAAILFGFAILVVGLFSLIYFMVQGEAQTGSAMHDQLVAGLESMVGDAFSVSLGPTEFDVDWSGKLAITSRDIGLLRKDNDAKVANIGQLRLNLKLLPLIQQKVSFSEIDVQEISLDAETLGISSDQVISPFLDQAVGGLRAAILELNALMRDGDLDEIRVRNSRVSGQLFGRIEQDPIELELLDVLPTRTGFTLAARMSTLHSAASFSSEFGPGPGDGNVFEFNLVGLSLSEWLGETDDVEGMFGSNGEVTATGTIPFDAVNQSNDPTLTLSVRDSSLRIGRSEVAPLKSAELYFRLILDRNQIELDPSIAELGGLTAELIGGLKPVEDKLGYAGPILYDIIMKNGVFAPTVAGEESIPAAFKAAGTYDRDRRRLTFHDAFLTTERGAIRGSGEFGLTDGAPSIRASARTDGISVTAVKQFWPMFITPGARQWVHDHVLDGWIRTGTLKTDIPPDVIFALRDGAKLSPDQFQLVAEMEQVKFLPLGDVPPISEGKGRLSISGMSLKATLDSGLVSDVTGGDALIEAGSFVMDDFAEEPRRGETKLRLSGSLNSIGEIGDAAPLRILERMKVAPDQFSGKAHVDLIARFPITPDAKYSDVDWNLLVDMENASSSKPLADRMITNADIVVDASPVGASVTGTADIDGVSARLTLIEPIGKSGATKRERRIAVSLDAEERKKLGVELAPVVTGPVTAEVQQNETGEVYQIDFSDAEIALPWVGWRKGAGIPATAKFRLVKNGKANRLEDFRLSGEGFGVRGALQFDKGGLVKADISSIVLNEGDDVAVTVTRDGSLFKIDVTGNSYDARGLLNALIHDASFSDAQGERSAHLTANIQRVTGFQGKSLESVLLDYQSNQDWITRVDLKASSGGGRSYSVDARRDGETTYFRFASNDAGNGLAFANIYSHMEGGQLLANLSRTNDGPFVGPVNIDSFEIVNEPRLGKLASSTNSHIERIRGENFSYQPVDGDKRVKFISAEASIEKGKGYLNVKDGIVRSTQIGLTYQGTIFDEKDRMNLSGTFMPAMAINFAVSAIPLIGDLFSNGADNGLIGITYRLKGPRVKPELVINPLSAVTPGVFNRVFEFRAQSR